MPVKDQVRPRGAAGRGRPRSGSESHRPGGAPSRQARLHRKRPPAALGAPEPMSSRRFGDARRRWRYRASRGSHATLGHRDLRRILHERSLPHARPRRRHVPRALRAGAPRDGVPARRPLFPRAVRAAGSVRLRAAVHAARARPPAPSPPGRDEGTARPGGAADPSPPEASASRTRPRHGPSTRRGSTSGSCCPSSRPAS